MKPKSLIAYIEQNPPSGEFTTKPIYNHIADAVDVFWADVGTYTQWLTSEVSLHRDAVSGEVVGVQICGISRLLPKRKRRMPRATPPK